MSNNKVLGTVTKEEADLLALLIEKINCADLALRTTSSEFSEDELKWFWQATINSLAEYKWLYSDTWKAIIEKYHLNPTGVYFVRDGVIYG